MRTETVAQDYDNYFRDHQLFRFDEQFVADRLARYGARHGQWIADLGCGTGRILVTLAQQGYRGLAIDLSAEMLAVVRQKAVRSELDIACLQANLVELDGLATAAVDHAVSLFSTLGMIRGRANRLRALQHVWRCLKPAGLCILHVHNFWFNLYDPGGPRWLVTNACRSLYDAQVERGDRYYPYRGVANMFLHVFTQREIRDLLQAAQFAVLEMLPLDAQLRGPLSRATWFSSLRASGWMVVARRQDRV